MQDANAKPETTRLWDVVAIDIKTGAHRVLAAAKDYRNAEACMTMAIVRRGVDVEFYKLLPHIGGQTNA